MYLPGKISTVVEDTRVELTLETDYPAGGATSPLALARDRRLGTEGTPVPVKEGKVSAKRVDSPMLPCQCCFEVTLDGVSFPMIDYASAGKTWRRDSQMEVWMEKA